MFSLQFESTLPLYDSVAQLAEQLIIIKNQWADSSNLSRVASIYFPPLHFNALQAMENAPTVWIVDDDEDDQLMIETAFKEVIFPLAVKQLSDGDELLLQLEKAPSLPKLILLDLNMQRKNGFEVLGELRSIPAYKKIPVVVLTTSSQAEDKQKSLALGASDFLTKPYSLQALIGMLRRLVSAWYLN